MDYDLIQKVWWSAMDYVQMNKDAVNLALEMRIFKGSECPLSPVYEFDFVCSI